MPCRNLPARRGHRRGTAVHALILACLVLLLGPGEPARFSGRVVSVTDGDTISVMRHGQPVTIRLDGIDCPETSQEMGDRAKQFTALRAFGVAVSVMPRNLDRYGRLVARVQCAGEDLSLALVRAGLAWHYARYSRDPSLAAAQAAARAEGAGVWRRRDPTPPWEFRRSGPTDVTASPGPFRANARTRVFHRPGCPNYTCAACSLVFGSWQEAVEAGFRPAGDCLRR